MTAPQRPRAELFVRGDVLQERYRIEGEIGRGGYSIVYQATDLTLGTDVALKLLVPPPAMAHIARERMRREARAVRGLAHPNVVALYDFLEEGPWTFVVMEHVRGPNLTTHVADRGPLSIDEVTRIGSEIASALTAAHRRGILHRDVKPQNVLIDVDGTARLTDFGSARLDGSITVTQTGAIVGTLPYTAPELFAGQRGDARSDVYSLGVTLYFALTGGLPEGRRNAPLTPSEDGFHPRLSRPDTPDWLDLVVAHATTASPASRIPTSLGVERALAGCETSTPDGFPTRVGACLICEGPELFGLGICPKCGANDVQPADALIFVGPCTSRERKALESVLESLLPARATRSQVNELAAGERPLIHLPSEAAERVIHHLALRSVPARVVARHATWRNLPVQFYVMLLLIAGVGGWAGLRVMWELLLVSPLISLLLWMVASRAARVAVIQPSQRASGFPAHLERRLVETFVSLSSRSARSLLSDLVRVSKGPYRKAMHSGTAEWFGTQIEELLESACEAASDLSDLDARLEVFGDRHEMSGNLSESWESQLAAAERARDGLVHKFLEAMTAVAHGDAVASSTDDAVLSLTEITNEIREDIRVYREARREVELALRS